MVGKVGAGILMLIFSLSLVGILVFGVWAFIDFLVILMGNFTDKDGYKVTA